MTLKPRPEYAMLADCAWLDEDGWPNDWVALIAPRPFAAQLPGFRTNESATCLT